jgi:putative transposase
MVGRSERQASRTLAQFDVSFRTWVLETYHHHQQRRLKGTPLDRWQQGTWLPRLPESQAQLDLLLLREGTSRQVHQEGIFFHGYRYMETKLTGCVGETVIMYYDPLDLATISVYVKDGPNEERFLCQAWCQELGDQTVSLKELVSARNAHRKQLHVRIEERKREVEQARTHLQRHKGLSVADHPSTSKTAVSSGSQFLPPPFMVQMAPEFLPEEEVAVSRREGCTNEV